MKVQRERRFHTLLSTSQDYQVWPSIPGRRVFFFVFSFDMTKMTSCYHFQWRKHPFLQLRQLDETGQMMAFHFSLTQKTPRNVTIINTRAIFLTWDTVPAMIRKGQWCHLRKWSRTSMPFFLILKTYIPTWF